MTACSVRKYTLADRDQFAELFGDHEVMRYVGDGVALTTDSAKELFERAFEIYRTDPSFFIWAVDVDGEYAGHAELKRRAGRSDYELAYILQRRRWGRGLGGLVVDLLLKEARDRRLAYVIATVHPNNAASIAILARRGFELDETMSAELACNAYRLAP
jgi:RimJ/RimL family protein N-acetyltransferase